MVVTVAGSVWMAEAAMGCMSNVGTRSGGNRCFGGRLWYCLGVDINVQGFRPPAL